MKRANGTGSVKKLKNRRKPWAAFKPSVFVDGKTKRELIGYYETKADAENALALEQIRPSSALRNIKLIDLFEMWQKTHAYTDLVKSTKQGYISAFKYMKDYHNRKFADLRQHHFQACIDSASDKSFSTQAKIKILCGILSDYAVVNDIIFKSYAINLRVKQAPKTKPPVFTDLEIQRLFDNDTMPLVDTILILIYSGMRISELLSLTKFQVDLKEMVIVGGVKTDKGKNRDIPIHPKIQQYIINRYNSCKNRLIEWEYKGETRSYSPNYYRKKYYQVLETLNIQKISPHKTRHTFFSLMDRYTKDKKAMADIGGHTDYHFTENVYVHTDIDRLRQAIECIP